VPKRTNHRQKRGTKEIAKKDEPQTKKRNERDCQKGLTTDKKEERKRVPKRTNHRQKRATAENNKRIKRD